MRSVFTLLWAISLTVVAYAPCRADDGVEFFEKKIRPVLVEHCYSCHSAEAKTLQGELRLDLKVGWQLGGESGEPAIVPGKPDESPLIRSIRHEEGSSAMPPKQAKLSSAVIADFAAWIKAGAVDPRDGNLERRDKAAEWESVFQSRLDWWSLKPVVKAVPPEVKQTDWPKTEVDRFILAELDAKGIAPMPEAERRALARRLSFALTGLPPDSKLVERYLADTTPQAYDELITALLDSPHFGERFARHWMDVVHYSDTHGYEWDVPAKNAWRYRDYLIRAFNADVPYRQMVLEQIAGDLVPPRVDPATSQNEALIAPMMLRLGERRHGDNSAVEGVTQEAVANMVDTLGKAFLGTTLACAQCHDHKLDAVEQRDYYSLAGMLMSTRFSARPVDAADPNALVIDELRDIKGQIRDELVQLWLDATDSSKSDALIDKIKAIPADEKPSAAFPSSIAEYWKRSLKAPLTSDEFTKERERRIVVNQNNLKLVADFTKADGDGGWKWEGFGMNHGLVSPGEMVITDEGDAALQHLLPAGRFSHVWSQRLAGSLQSPPFDSTNPVTFSIGAAIGKFASSSFIVDRALNPERLTFTKLPEPAWHTLTAGNFDSLEGTIDKAPRRVYFELATKSLNNYFPPRTAYNGISEAEVTDPRSWFGVTRIYSHAPGQAPLDELDRFAPLFNELAQEAEWSKRLVFLVRAAVERWSKGECRDEDVRLINDAIVLKLLPVKLAANAEVSRLVNEYRAVEKRLQPDQTIGTTADWNEGRDERIGIRGSYTEFGDSVPRGAVRFLSTNNQAPDKGLASSGRLAWAQRITDERNPLIARVYVNRVWHYLYGEGLVRTPDDFGHLGDAPSHPALLDYLATRFVEEGWSTKKLVRLLVTSAVWRQSSVPDPKAVEIDPENRLWHHYPMRRLEAEAIRDSLLAVSGRLDRTLFGPPVEPYRTAEDASKRLFKGPLDGDGRRSIYLEMTLMEPPRFLALFNQPIPKQTVGRRDVSNVPDQALAMLNDPFVVAMAEHWSRHLIADGAPSAEVRVARMLAEALARPARPAEVAGVVELVRRSAELRHTGSGDAQDDLLSCQAAWQDAAHAIFNLKEFVYVR